MPPAPCTHNASALQKQITSTSSQISRLQSELGSLKMMRNATESAFLSKLSLELITEILSFVIHSQKPHPLEGTNDDFPVVYQIHPKHPLTFQLSSVCRAWKDIIHSNSHFWQDICIDVSVDKERKVRHELLQAWIANSKNQPLNVCLHWEEVRVLDEDGYDLTVECPADIFHSLLAVSHRWRSWTLLSYGFPPLPEWFRRDTAFPLLSSFTLRSELRRPETPIDAAQGFDYPFPTFCGNMSLDIAPASVQVSWGLLTRLSLKNSTLTDIFFLVEACSKGAEPAALTDLDITLFFEDRFDQLRNIEYLEPPRCLPNLTNLAIALDVDNSDTKPKFIEDIFHSINVPALKNLSLIAKEGMMEITDDQCSTLAEDIQRWDCKLETLVLEELQTIGPLLDGVPSIATLEVTSSDDDVCDSLMAHLEIESSDSGNIQGDPQFLPNLKHLKITGPICSELQDVVDFIQSRANSTAPLDSVHIVGATDEWLDYKTVGEYKRFKRSIRDSQRIYPTRVTIGDKYYNPFDIKEGKAELVERS